MADFTSKWFIIGLFNILLYRYQLFTIVEHATSGVISLDFENTIQSVTKERTTNDIRLKL